MVNIKQLTNWLARIERTLVLLSLIYLISGCTTTMSNRKYFSDYINQKETLKKEVYLCELDPKRPGYILTACYDRKGLHYMFDYDPCKASMCDACLGKPLKLSPGTPLVIKDFLKYNYFEGTSLHAFGEVYHPVKKVYVPFEVTLQRKIESKPCKKRPFLSTLLGADCRDYTEKLEPMPWDPPDITQNRIILEEIVY